jgi:uncharacterized membrane protein
MRFILLTVLTSLLVVCVNPFFPYWTVMLGIVIISSIINPSGLGAFLGAGLGMGLAWLGQSIYLSSVTSSSLPDKIAQLMGLGSEFSLSLLTAILGFFLGAFSGLTGVVWRTFIKKPSKNIYKGPK